MLHGMGIETGIDVAKLKQAGAMISFVLNKTTASRVALALG
jgi:hydroxymethylglutaryl-CoA lyase